jgi:ABC-type lipoprotein export system ATPase subunit
MAPILQVENVSKRYNAVALEGPEVLRNVSLCVNPGESLAVVGPSGSGKTTLLNIIGALDRPTTGRVILDGDNLADLDETQLAELRNCRVGFVFQSHHLLPQCTVLENVLVPTLVNRERAGRSGTQSAAKELLDRVGLSDRLSYRPGQLSGGERQRVAVVRALINQPKLLLADEPTGSLDAEASGHLAQLLVELNHERGVTLIMVTHDRSLASRMGRLLTLSQGTLVPQDAQP